MINVPKEFRPKENNPYPKDNFKSFEAWFSENYDPSRNKSDREYLPIQFTAYYVNNTRKWVDPRALGKLQDYLNKLDTSKKYFSVVQYDDGIINKVKHLDLKVFGTGCKGDVQLPLVCQPHKYDFSHLPQDRPIFASFVGKITHPIRQKLVDELKGKKGYYISTEDHGLESYCYIMSQSKYVLCPRGYGKTSFRIMEAIQYGATPVYITDDPLFREGCIYGGLENIDMIPGLSYFNKDAKQTFEKYYTYEAVANRIYENL